MMAECLPEMSVWRSTEQMCLGLKCDALGGGGRGSERERQTERRERKIEREREGEKEHKCLTSYICFLHEPKHV